MKMPSRIQRDENLELKEKHTISFAVLDMKRLNMRYNIIVASLHVLLCCHLLKHGQFRQVSQEQMRRGSFHTLAIHDSLDPHGSNHKLIHSPQNNVSNPHEQRCE
jgi:hypothetical protein